MLDAITDLGLHPGAIEAIVNARHGDPFAVLGPHDGSVRAFIPGADTVSVVDRATGRVVGELDRLHPTGFFAGPVQSHGEYLLRIGTGAATWETEDPYSFAPLLGDVDIYLLAEGRHRDFGRCLGAHPVEIDGASGVRFAVWAPNAQRVSVVGDFNNWDGRRHPMRKRHGPGVWELFVPRIGAGTLYKFEMLGPWGELLPLKADPVAWAAQIPPQTASIVADDIAYPWTDAEWIAARGTKQSEGAPISIYEIHAGSWSPAASMGVDGWDRLADKLVTYAASMGFTHIELMPIMEHPFGGSWGYQPLGQFAPSSRLGPPEAFAHFVDRCHAAGIGVILDWVPAHFPTDAYGLANFDGTALYEHQDPREGFHRDWNTLIYNLGRNEVRAFLIGSALFWLEHYHADGIRVDAVASMLYRDYSRNAGEWVPNKYGGRENLESVSFLQELSRAVAERVPGAVLIAEESTAWPGVTRSVDEGGLGFTFKWNMGWMHDTLHYIEESPVYRKYHHGEMTFGLVYAFSEKFVLPISHDEVVYGKGSLLGKMPGDRWQKFANLRAYLGFMWTHPGKKLLFMGQEIAQEREWNHDHGLDWDLLDQPEHRGTQALVRDLNALYRNEPALHRFDCQPEGFRWVNMDDPEQSVLSYLRLAGDAPPALVVCNFTPVPRYGYRVGVPQGGRWKETFNSDAGLYGGSNLGNGGGVDADGTPWNDLPHSVTSDFATACYDRARRRVAFPSPSERHMSERFAHLLPFGAELDGDTTRFRVWAPSAERLSLELDGALTPMQTEPGGWFTASAKAPAGTPYRYSMADGMAFPDPASRAQAGDVHDPSLVVDACSYVWQHAKWQGRPWHEAVVYELHPGTFGGFEGIRSQLPRLAALGVTAVELMPIADFPGARNWGYDGVLPYAPDAAYGTPNQLKALIDEAHGLGLMVMLDVVYNHFGPDGAYIHAFAKSFFREDVKTPWGASIDFRRPEVRQYFEQNALYWLMEYRFDGLRFDAVHAIGDPGFLDEMAALLRRSVEPGRHIHLVLEHEGNAARHLRTGPDAPGYDAQWTDDVHHCLHVLLTGESEGYYEDFDQPIQRLARTMAEGFAYQGEVSKHSGKPRGEPSGHLPTTSFVICLQNHDQIGNRAMGERLTQLADPQALRAATVLLLLSPFIPMLFMGEEVASPSPFLFFTSHNEELAELVREGRRAEFKHFAAFQDPERREKIPDPNAPSTFQASVPSFSGDSSFVHTLLEVRRTRVVPGIPGCRSAGVEVLGKSALVARWHLGTGGTLAIAVNLGDEKLALRLPIGDTIFEAPIGAWDAAMYGTLLEKSAVAWIEPAS